MAPRVDRKLAAIMAVDVVGYSRLVGIDEVGTLARVKAHIGKFAEPLISKYGGRVVKPTGDGVLAEFASAVDAVECSAVIQEGMLEREASEPEDRRIWFRIGINLGDIIHDDGDIFGDSVNIAARLEGLAEPGGICIERNVYDHVKAKLKLSFEPAGEHRVKNIADPVTVYRVDLGPSALVGRSSRLRRLQIAMAGIVVLLALSLGGYWSFFLHPTTGPGSSVENTTQGRLAQQTLDLPSIVVLPFNNGSGGSEMDYFSDGLTEELMIGLSKSPEVLVVSRNTAFSYKGKSTDVRKIGQELGVRYVLEGSVRRNTNSVRITAQLIDATSGHHVWAERYDNEDSDIFLLQDEVTDRIFNTLLGRLGEINRAEIERAWSTQKTSLREYDFVLRGHDLLGRFTKEDTARAREIWFTGMEEFPKSGSLSINIGWSYFQDVRRGWSPNPDGDLERALEFASNGLATDNLPRRGQLYGHWLLAELSVWYLKDFERAIAEAEKTQALFPGLPNLLASLCKVYLYSGQPSVALKNIDEALRRNPRPAGYYYRYKGWALFMQENYEEAVRWLRKKKGYEFPAKRLLAASYAYLGREDDAKETVVELLEHHPNLTIASLSEELPYGQLEDLERELIGLTKAGLPVGKATPSRIEGRLVAPVGRSRS